MGIPMNGAVADPEGASGLPAGVYHVAVESSGIDPKSGKLKVVFVCLAGKTAAGDTEKCVQMKKIEFFALGGDDFQERRLFKLAWALGMITMEQWNQIFHTKQRIELPLDNCRGWQCCIEVQRKPGKEGTPNEGKWFDNVDDRFWPISDPGTMHIPKDMAWAAQAPGVNAAQQPPAATAPVAPPAAQPVHQPPATGPAFTPPPAQAAPPPVASPTNVYGGF